MQPNIIHADAVVRFLLLTLSKHLFWGTFQDKLCNGNLWVLPYFKSVSEIQKSVGILVKLSWLVLAKSVEEIMWTKLEIASN